MRLGQLLAPYAVRYVVVVDNLAPSIPGFQSPLGTAAPPADLEPALISQLDLRQIIGQGGFEVFVDDAALPERAVLGERTLVAGGVTRRRVRRQPASPVGPDEALAGWTPVLAAAPGRHRTSTGHVPAGTVVAAVAPSRAWELVGPAGKVEPSHTIFGYAAVFRRGPTGTVTVGSGVRGHTGSRSPSRSSSWLVAVGLLVGRRRSVARWWGRLHGACTDAGPDRSRSDEPTPDVDGDDTPAPVAAPAANVRRPGAV